MRIVISVINRHISFCSLSSSCKGSWVSSILLLFLKIQNLAGECTSMFIRDNDYRYNIQCTSVDESELMSFFSGYEDGRLIIQKSFLPHIEMFPWMRLQSLTIKNSSVETFNPTEFDSLHFLDLSFNKIGEMDFLKYTISRDILLHHNRIEFLNGSNLYKNIVTLDLSHNHIKNLTKLECRQLLTLNLSHNSIESLGNFFTECLLVEMIDLSYNKLRMINANETNLCNLKFLNLSHNNIQYLQYTRDFNHGFFIRDRSDDAFVDLSSNNIKPTSDMFIKNDGGDYCFRTFHISHYYLKTIHIENNNLEDLKFLLSNDSRIIYGNNLILHHNKIKTIYPFNFKSFKLTKLDLSLNEIETVPPFAFEGSQITELSLDQNRILTLNYSSFTALSGLKRLNLSFNPLTKIDGLTFRNSCELVESIDISHCFLREIPVQLFRNLINLSKIYLSYNNIEVIEPNTFQHLQILDLSNNRIKNLPANVFSGLEITTFFDLSFNPLETLENIFKNARIQNISLRGIFLSKLSEREIRGLEEFEFLDLSNTSIVELSNNTFDHLSSLNQLILDNNSIEMIPSNFFAFNKRLMSLSILRNPISIMAFDSFSHKMMLKYLHLTFNGKILEKRFYNLIFLEELHFKHSLVTEIHKYSFEGLGNLKTLNFENSTVLDIEPGAFLGLGRVVNFDAQNLFANITILKSEIFVGLEALQRLDLSSLGIDVIENRAFQGLHSLSNIILTHNEITKLPKNALAGLNELKLLDLSNNKLMGQKSFFPLGIFRDLIKLTYLHLEHNRIEQFHAGVFTNLENLRLLNLSHNKLRYIDGHLIFPLRSLEVLDINSNLIGTLNYQFILKHLPSLKIGIGHNNWDCEYLFTMLGDFENQKINYKEISEHEFQQNNIGGIYCDCSKYDYCM